jgi:hypothetical protein
MSWFCEVASVVVVVVAVESLLAGSVLFSPLLHAIKTKEITSAMIAGLLIFFHNNYFMMNEWRKKGVNEGIQFYL